MKSLILIICIVVGLITFAINDEGTIVRDYFCPDCKASPETYVPMQTSPPKCNKCGEFMKEYNGF